MVLFRKTGMITQVITSFYRIDYDCQLSRVEGLPQCNHCGGHPGPATPPQPKPHLPLKAEPIARRPDSATWIGSFVTVINSGAAAFPQSPGGYGTDTPSHR